MIFTEMLKLEKSPKKIGFVIVSNITTSEN